MSVATKNLPNAESIPMSEVIASTQPIDSKEYAARLDAAIRSAKEPIRLPSLKDFFHDVMATIRSKSETHSPATVHKK